jgi:hypothetical protein
MALAYVAGALQRPKLLLVPRCFFQDGRPILCVFNPTESPYTLRKNAVIAQAYEAKVNISAGCETSKYRGRGFLCKNIHDGESGCR